MAIKHAILGLLADRSVHGYDLKSSFEQDLVPSGTLNFGQVYTTLDRLTKDGLVGHEVVAQTVRPDKKVYALTEAGRAELAAWLAAPTPLELDLRNETFLKLMVARRVEWARPAKVLAIERRACLARMHEMAQAKNKADREGGRVQVKLLLELALLRLEAFAKWLDRCGELLGQEEESGR